MAGPRLGRLPVAVCLATLGLGVGAGIGIGSLLLGSSVAYAQSSAVPTRMAPLLIDPALLGGAPAVAPPSLPAALGGSLPASASAKKAAAKKAAVQEPMAQMPATKPVEAAASTPVTPAPATTVAAKSEPVSAPVVPDPEPAPAPTPAPAPSTPTGPTTPRVPSSPSPVAAESGRALRDQELPKAADPTVAETSLPQPQTPAAQAAAKTPTTALPKDQTELLADAITGRNDLELTATGHAELRRDGTILNADRIVYNIVEDNVDAQGNVLYRDPTQGTTMAGTDAEIVVAARRGYINNVNYEIRQQKRISQTNNPWSFFT